MIDIQIHDFENFNRETFNVGGGVENTISLLELTGICEEITSNSISIEPELERNADLRIYYTNNEKILSKSKWRPRRDIRRTLEDIYSWVSEYENILKDYY